MPSAPELIPLLHEYLDVEGFRPVIDSEGDLSFRSEGLIFHVITDPADTCFLGICLPDLLRVAPGDDAELRVLRVLNRLNRTSRAVKLVTDDTGREVLAVYQAVLPQAADTLDPAMLGDVILRGIDALIFARTRLDESHPT